MTLTRQLPLSAARENMWRLVWIRTIALIGQLAGIGFVWGYLGAQLHYPMLVLVVFTMSFVTLATILRLKQNWLVTDAEYFVQLLIDVFGLSLVLYFSGGSTNPFISYFLVILIICAATLPWRYTLSMAGITFAAYSLLLFYFQPLTLPMQGPDHMAHGRFFNLHVLGMWLTFLISALLITFFVVKMAQAIRQQDAALAAQRETTLHDEQLLAVATLAAGTAHELGTPLSTISVLINELQQDYPDNEPLQKDLVLLEKQVLSCKESMRTLVDKFTQNADEQALAQPVDVYMQDILERWRVTRPDVSDHFVITGSESVPLLEVDETMGQAIMNLLNNAGDASPERIDIELDWDEQQMRLSIHDFGGGIPAELAEKLGKPFVSTKRKGLGLGLFLSHATVLRYAGSLALYNHEEGGTLTELLLPVTRLEGECID